MTNFPFRLKPVDPEIAKSAVEDVQKLNEKYDKPTKIAEEAAFGEHEPPKLVEIPAFKPLKPINIVEDSKDVKLVKLRNTPANPVKTKGKKGGGPIKITMR